MEPHRTEGAPAVPFLDLAAAARELEADLLEATARVMRSGRYLLGPEVAAFEREFAAFCGAPHCVGVGNGFDAIHLALRALGIGPGDEVIVPANTYIATWLGVSRAGATPVPVEPAEETHNIDPARIEAALTPRTRAIVPVHLYGRAADMEEISRVAAAHDLLVVDDAAQAHGARHDARRVGSLAHATAFSFYPGKNLGALGDGGAVTTADPEVADRVRVLANYGSRVKYHHEAQGVNSRLDELHAAGLRVKLARLDEWNARRARAAERYRAALGAVRDLVLPGPGAEGEHAWHLFVVRHGRRDALRAHLEAAGIGTLIHYPVPPHLSGAYAGHSAPALPLTERLAGEVLSLPIGPHLTEDQQDRVCRAVAAFT